MTNQQILSPNKLSRLLCIPRNVLENIAANAVRYYHPFKIDRPDKKPRIIDNPNKDLKNVQRRINDILLRSFPFPDYIQGAVKGRSPLTNARHHLGKRLVVCIDIEDFFPSITDRKVYSIWVGSFGCSRPVASLLTALTTYHNHLPQGAPTSSSLANLALLEVDSVIGDFTSQANCSYTRYVDDLTISGDHPERLLDVTLGALQRAGFRISREKLSLLSSSGRQEVTGLSVNSRRTPSFPRYRRDRVRAAIRQIPSEDNVEHAVASARGRVSHFSRTNPGNARALLRNIEIISTEATAPDTEIVEVQST